MLVAQAALVLGALFIVQLVEAFEGLAAHQAWGKPWLGAGQRGQHIDPQVKSRHQIAFDLRPLFLLFVDHLNHIAILARNDSQLSDLFPIGEPGRNRQG